MEKSTPKKKKKQHNEISKVNQTPRPYPHFERVSDEVKLGQKPPAHSLHERAPSDNLSSCLELDFGSW